MIRTSIRSIGALGLLLFLLSASKAQLPVEDYRQYFKPPETVMEYWKAIQFEIDLGAYQTAAVFIKGFKDKLEMEKDAEKLILQIEARDGMSSFLKLRSVPKWSDDPKLNDETRKRVEDLIESVTATLKTHLGDPVRIEKLVNQLAATSGERLYAIRELRRSRDFAIPHLVKQMQELKDTDEDKYLAVTMSLAYLGREAMPALYAALAIDDPVIRASIVDGIRRRPDLMLLTSQWDTNPIPHLWHLAGSSRHPPYLREMAKNTLAALYQTHPEKLPPARTELLREAEKFYQRKVKFVDPQNVTVWRWDGKEVMFEAATASRAEEYHGLRFAQLALDIDPGYEPAQMVALSVATERAMELAGLDQPLARSPRLRELLTTINPEIIAATLDRAVSDRRTAVALGLVRAIGDRMDTRAGRPKGSGVPPLVRALNYPDRRVQFAAADTLLRLPGPPPPQAPVRIVEIFRRILQSEPVPRVVIADFNRDRGHEIAKAVKEAGYDPIVLQTGRELLQRLREAADIDAVFVDFELPDPNLRTLLPQLRADVDIAQLPLFITIPPLPQGNRPPDTAIPLERMIEPYRNVYIMQATNDPEILKPLLQQRITAAMGKPLTEEERKNMMTESMVWLRRLALGEPAGYTVSGAEPAILKVMRNEELAALAVEAAGRLPGRTPQRELAGIVLDEAVRAEVRRSAAVELARHIQANSMVLSKNQIIGLDEIFKNTNDGQLKANVALVLGAMQPNIYRTGDRIRQFVPGAPEPAGKPEPGKKDEKMEKKDMEKKEEK
jgi:CheY-like chemotaxis protein